MISLISNLRGGQQRYMPLLLSKIENALPNNPHYMLNYTAGSSNGTGIYDESEMAESHSASSRYDSPSMSAFEQQDSHAYNGFQEQFGPTSAGSSNFADAMPATTTQGYDGMISSAPAQVFPDPNEFYGLNRYDSG